MIRYASLLLATLTLAPAAYAHGGSHPPAAPHPAEAPSPAAPAAPQSYEGVIDALRQRAAVAQEALDGGRLAEVHPSAEALVSLAVSLPGKATGFAKADKATIALKALDLKQQALWLHEKADAGDAAGARTALAAVVADIDILATFPK